MLHRERDRPPPPGLPVRHLTREFAVDLFKRSGLDFEALKKQAQSRDFRPVAINAKLKATIANKNRELAQFKTDFPALLRAVNQLTLENQQLREALANPHGTVIPFPRTNSCDRS